jgi:CHRD domain-containing protein
MTAFKFSSLAASVAALTFGLSATADDGKPDNFRARLSSYNEVHFIAGPPAALRGAISSAASGSFRADIDDKHNAIDYTLSYSGLESPVTQAHIHFGQRHTPGGIVVWLCQTATVPAPAAVAAVTPVCPQEGTVSGTISPNQVLTVTGQGIDAGEFDELLRAIRAGATYANVHTAVNAPGEIRGQLRHGGRGHDRD